MEEINRIGLVALEEGGNNYNMKNKDNHKVCQ